MGYEVMMSIGRVHDENFYETEESKGHRYFRIDATVDLCKPGYDSSFLMAMEQARENAPEQKPVYLYAPMGDGDTQVVKDRYDAKLFPIPIQDALDALRKDEERDPYRRFKWAVALLEAMADDTENLMVVAWGY